MKKKRAKTVHELLGPDGKQLDINKYRKPPEKKIGLKIGLDGGANARRSQLLQRLMESYYGIGIDLSESKPKKQGPSLEERVARDLESIQYPKDFPKEGSPHAEGKELPQPYKDLDTYADALASARAKCSHDNLINTLYNREWQCADCEKYFDLREVQALARRRGW